MAVICNLKSSYLEPNLPKDVVSNPRMILTYGDSKGLPYKAISIKQMGALNTMPIVTVEATLGKNNRS